MCGMSKKQKTKKALNALTELSPPAPSSSAEAEARRRRLLGGLLRHVLDTRAGALRVAIQHRLRDARVETEEPMRVGTLRMRFAILERRLETAVKVLGLFRQQSSPSQPQSKKTR